MCYTNQMRAGADAESQGGANASQEILLLDGGSVFHVFGIRPNTGAIA